MKIKAVIFDLDGTLINFNLDYRAVRIDVRNFLIKIGIAPSILSKDESIFEMLKKARVFMKDKGKSEQEIKITFSKALNIAEKYEFEAAKTTNLLLGVMETLKALRNMNLKIGLCTINSERSTKYILNHFKIADFFDALTPRDRVEYVKPNVEHLKATLKVLKINPEEAILVGDGVSDMKCAKELKVIAVCLPSSASTLEELIKGGANYLITSLSDLPTLIEHLDKASN